VAPHEPDAEQTSSSHMVILRIAVQRVSKGRSQVGRTLILYLLESVRNLLVGLVLNAKLC
jgi:hypothetical protein